MPTIRNAAIKIGDNIYEAKDHGKAIEMAREAGEDISGIDRERDGMFATDDGRLINRQQSKKEFGITHSHQIEFKKKVLIISEEVLAPDLYLRLKNEGCDVAIAQKFQETKGILKGTLKRIPWDTKMEYAQTCDLVVCDDNTNDYASQLRKAGISAIGGDKQTIKIELDRKFASHTAKLCGLLTPEVVDVKDLEDAKNIIKERGGKWVLKQCGKLDSVKGLNAIAKLDNSEDVISYIEFLQKNWIEEIPQEFVLQEKIEGHEMAVGSYWNGKEFMKDKEGNIIIEENFEHKPLMVGNMGESTGEMFTVMRYTRADQSKLYRETLEKITPLLERIDFRGDFDINTIVTKKGAYFLEYTPRMGVPATSAQIAIHKSSWYDFLKAMADGNQDKNFEYDGRFCIVAWLYTKPFPFGGYSKELEQIYQDELVNFDKPEQVQELLSFKLSNSKDLEVLLDKSLTKEQLDNIHWDGIYYDNGKIKVGNEGGYVLTATGLGDSVDEAGKKVEEIFKKIRVPKSFYRNDFHNTNYHKAKEDLKNWGYILPTKEEIEAIENEKIETRRKQKEEKRQKVREKLKEIVYVKKEQNKENLPGNI